MTDVFNCFDTHIHYMFTSCVANKCECKLLINYAKIFTDECQNPPEELGTSKCTSIKTVIEFTVVINRE